MICKQIAHQTCKEQFWPVSSTEWDAYEENESAVQKEGGRKVWGLFPLDSVLQKEFLPYETNSLRENILKRN